MNTNRNVIAMNALNDALVAAGQPLAIVTGAMTRILNQQRKESVINAIKYDMRNRMNARIATGAARPGDMPHPALSYLSDCMTHARRHEARLLRMM